MDESDQGEYSCEVQNIHGADKIGYEVIVQVPPSIPELLIRNVTSKAIQLLWLSVRSRKQPVLGYSIMYRKEHGDWRQVDCDPISDSLWIGDLACGNNYSIYLTAYNHVGQSHPSDVVTAKTDGRGGRAKKTPPTKFSFPLFFTHSS